MLDFKYIIAEEISKASGIEKKEIKSYIEVPKDSKMGDYAFPCFKLAKILKKAPQIIARKKKKKRTIWKLSNR